MMRGWPLAVRLTVLLAGAVIIVLLLAGVVVNRAATHSLDETLGPREEQRLGLAVALVEEGLERGVDGRGMRMLLGRVARESGGLARIVDANGDVVAQAGREPPGESTTLRNALSSAAGGGALEVTVPSAQAPFLRAFNAALLLIGIVAVATLAVVAVVVASRVTRPLREVAHAAHRLGDGDLGARASGGPDAESQELATAFNGMADRLERSELLRRRAASDLAHDLATPATVLESQLQAMVDGVVPADAGQLEKARVAAASLSGVISQLGELTQAEAAPLQRRVERIDLEGLVQAIVTALDGLIRERGVTARIEGVAPAVAGDAGQLGRALRNVVTNAIQHAPSGSEVVVALGERAGGATVRISDRGPGIADADLPYVFERFYRADRARGGRRPGSGIGLTVARELLAANGGTIDVERTGPDGTVFRIVLPSTG
jgi:two-component system sensor histidine kinase BaeS